MVVHGAGTYVFMEAVQNLGSCASFFVCYSVIVEEEHLLYCIAGALYFLLSTLFFFFIPDVSVLNLGENRKSTVGRLPMKCSIFADLRQLVGLSPVERIEGDFDL